MTHHRRVARCVALLVACAAAVSCSWVGSTRGSANVLLHAHTDVAKPFVWLYPDCDDEASGFQARLEGGDPLQATTIATACWLKTRDIALAEQRVEQIIEKWQLDEPGKFLDYKYAYNGLKPGWRSGMDSYSFPLLLVSVWQETGNDRYLQLARRLLDHAGKDVTDGGLVWRETNGCWFSEYAWDGMTADDEYHVLNGHLYALQAVRMIAEAIRDQELHSLYECGLAATKARAEEFKIGTQWARYMLRPSTINPVHYLIIETMQFDAMVRLDPDSFYAEQAALRRNLLNKYFPVRFVAGEDGSRLWLSALGAPHPYWIDTYPLYLTCRDGAITEVHAIRQPRDESAPLQQRVFLDAPTELDPDKAVCRVESRYAGHAQMLYESPVLVLREPVAPGRYLDASIAASLDAQLMDSGEVLIDPKPTFTVPPAPTSYLDTQGRLTFTLESPVQWPDEGLIGFEFSTDGSLSLGVVVTSSGKQYFRYLPPVHASERAVVLLSPVGFNGGDGISNVENLVIFFYTDKQERPVMLKYPRLVSFANQAELYRYISTVAPDFRTQ